MVAKTKQRPKVTEILLSDSKEEAKEPASSMNQVAMTKITEKKRDADDKDKGVDLASLLLNHMFQTYKQEESANVLMDLKATALERSDIRKAIDKTDICAHIVQAMQADVESADVQWKFCDVICGLTSKHDRNKSVFLNLGASAVIHEAMSNFPSNADMQFHGCAALEAICEGNSERKLRIVQEGGIEAVVRAMRSCKEDRSIQRRAALFFLNLMEGDVKKEFTTAIREKEGGIALAEAEHRFSGSENAEIGGKVRSALVRLFLE